MKIPDTTPGCQRTAAAGDADRWMEAARLRREHPGWVVIWLASADHYRAYPLVRARDGTALAADTPAGLALQMAYAEQEGRRRAATRSGARHADAQSKP